MSWRDAEGKRSVINKTGKLKGKSEMKEYELIEKEGNVAERTKRE